MNFQKLYWLIGITCLSFCGCLGAPSYVERAAVPGEVYGQGGPLSALHLGLVYTENAEQAFQYMDKHMSHGHRALVPFLERVDPKRVKDGLGKIVKARFKRVTQFTSLDQAVKSDVDMILAFDYRCMICQKPGQETTVDMIGTFMNRQERIIDVAKGNGLARPAYVSFTYGFGEALAAAFEQFTAGLDKSSSIFTFAERRSVPAAFDTGGTTTPFGKGEDR